MKRRIVFSMTVVALAVWAVVQAPAPAGGLAAWMPPGALLCLEARDFSALVRDWNASGEKPAWLASDNFQVFSRSRLYLRLADAQAEFASAAGLPVDMRLVDSVAGGESALALYDIGSLQFLYITKLPSARALETVLWRTRSSYESRNAAGLPYFIRVDPASHRVAAFAAANDYLLLATREDLIAGALTLLAGKPGATITGERWYSESLRSAGPRGDLRLVMNLSGLVRSPYFRSYWVQRNVSDLRQFGAGISDLHRTPAEIREERVLLRFDQPDTTEPSSVTDVARLAGDGAGLYRAWAKPAASAALDLIQKKILSPGPAAPPPSEMAPGVVSSGVAGSESDLETRIDEPPLDTNAGTGMPEAIRKLIEAAPLEAMVNVGSSRNVAGDVFVNIDTAVVLVASADWDSAAVSAAFAAAPASGPLGRISAEAHGRVLIVATSQDLARKIAAAVPSSLPAASPGAGYAAVFRHAAERPNFLKMTRLIDSAPAPRMPDGAPREPRFFSENIGSLSAVLARMESTSITAHDTGPAVFETVTYRFVK